MNILVINGSPKGANSITLQTVLYLQKRFPAQHFEFLHAAARLSALERDFSPVLPLLETADVLLFAYPVYTFLAPSQLHRFFELLKASDADVRGKYATQLTTSKHFYDVTAHAYVQQNAQDLGLRFVQGLSADMEDLLSATGQRQAEDFFRYLCWCREQGIAESAPLPQPAASCRAVTVPESHGAREGDVVILTDAAADDAQLSAMIARFAAVLPRRSRVVNLREYPFKGGCLGCFHCAVDGRCVYTDGFDTFLRQNIQTGEAIIFAFTIRDHSMGSLFKLYDDRQFCNGHRTVTMGMPMGYLISGAYSRESNLQTVVEARAQVGGNFLCGVATDERDPDGEIDALAGRLTYALAQRYAPPRNFYGVGGMKIFRDLIWQMQGMMKADHRFYKAHGQYDFPQKRPGAMLKMYLVGALLSSPALMKKAGGKINEGMLAPYKKVLDKLK